MMQITKVMLAILFLAMAAATVSAVAGLEMFVGRAAQYVCWVALILCFVIPISLLLKDVGILLLDMNSRQQRRWGYAFGLIGFVVAVICGGNDNPDAPIVYNLIGVGVGFSLVGLAWLINHWPPRHHTQRLRRRWE